MLVPPGFKALFLIAGPGSFVLLTVFWSRSAWRVPCQPGASAAVDSVVTRMGAEEGIKLWFLTSHGPCVYNHVLNRVLGHILKPDTVTEVAILADSTLVTVF